jgi:arylsulfatase
MTRKLCGKAFGLLSGVSLTMIVACADLQAQEGQQARTDAIGKPPYNVVFLIVDQLAYRLLAGPDYSRPALDSIARHGVTFQNHYISSAMCSPSRASFLTGQPPQVTGVIDQMQYDYSHSLSPDMPNVGSVLKGLGYRTAYFGKFEMDKAILNPKPTINYTTAFQPYGFELASAGGDIGSAPDSGFDNDAFIAGEAVRWLRISANEARRIGKPFFLVASFVNPHDIMFGNGNIPGQPEVQKPVVPWVAPPPPANSIYEKKWSFKLRQVWTSRLPGPACPKHYWNTTRAGTPGLAQSLQIAKTCGPSSTTTTSMTFKTLIAESNRSWMSSMKWICGGTRSLSSLPTTAKWEVPTVA